jgi:hypothetical protein
MSWRSGAALFEEIWHVLQARVRHKQERRELTAGVLRLLIDHDLDPQDVADIHPEVVRALADIGVAITSPSEPGDAIADCIRELRSATAADRATAAEALRHFISEADNPSTVAASALTGLAVVLSDDSPKVRREAAMSVRALLRAGHPPPSGLADALRVAATHQDAVLAKRARESLSLLARDSSA